MKKTIEFLMIVAALLSANVSFAKGNDDSDQSDKRPREVTALGVGFGFDYSGIGVGLTIYPQKNIGVFANGGIFLAGPSYTVGLKARCVTKSIIDPYVSFQYGHSGNVSVIDDDGHLVSDKAKIFIKPNIGAGVDIHFTKNLCLTTGLTSNFAVSDMRDYMDELEENGEADFSDSIVLPFGISCGLRWRIR